MFCMHACDHEVTSTSAVKKLQQLFLGSSRKAKLIKFSVTFDKLTFVKAFFVLAVYSIMYY